MVIFALYDFDPVRRFRNPFEIGHKRHGSIRARSRPPHEEVGFRNVLKESALAFEVLIILVPSGFDLGFTGDGEANDSRERW